MSTIKKELSRFRLTVQDTNHAVSELLATGAKLGKHSNSKLTRKHAHEQTERQLFARKPSKDCFEIKKFSSLLYCKLRMNNMHFSETDELCSVEQSKSDRPLEQSTKQLKTAFESQLRKLQAISDDVKMMNKTNKKKPIIINALCQLNSFNKDVN